MALKPVKRANITEQVFEQMKKQIVTGKWVAGDKLPSENELSETFGVSRVTVRQALQKLTALGLVETRTGEGSFISSSPGGMLNSMLPLAYLGEHSILQVLEFRKVIETETAGLAAQKATESDIENLSDILQQMKQYKDDKTRFAKLDLDFHFAIAKMTQNDLIISIHTILKDVLSSSMKGIVGHLGHEVGIRYHEKLIKSISLNDYERTKGIMGEHLDETASRMRIIVKQL